MQNAYNVYGRSTFATHMLGDPWHTRRIYKVLLDIWLLMLQEMFSVWGPKWYNTTRMHMHRGQGISACALTHLLCSMF